MKNKIQKVLVKFKATVTWGRGGADGCHKKFWIVRVLIFDTNKINIQSDSKFFLPKKGKMNAS